MSDKGSAQEFSLSDVDWTAELSSGGGESSGGTVSAGSIDMGSMLSEIGADIEDLKVRKTGEISEQRADQVRDTTLLRAGIDYVARGGGRTGLLFGGIAGSGSDSKADPTSLRVALAQRTAEETIGTTAGSLVGGLMQAGATAQKFLGQAVDTAVGWFNDGEGVVGSGSKRDALYDSAPENLARFADPTLSPEEMAAATGQRSPFAFALGQAIGDIGFMFASNALLPGSGSVQAVRAGTTIGKLFQPAKAFLSNPGGKVYLGYMGGRSATSMSNEVREYFDQEAKLAEAYNTAIDDLGLPAEKVTPDQYSVFTDIGSSLSAGVLTAAMETVSAGFLKLGGQRVVNRLMYGTGDKVVDGGLLGVLRAGAGSLGASAALEGSEELLETYKDAFIRGAWNKYEDGQFLKTFSGKDFAATLKQYAPEALQAFAIGALVGAPIGGAGGLAGATRRSAGVRALQLAIAEDTTARQDGRGPEVAAATMVARYLTEREMRGDSDPVVKRVVMKWLSENGLDVGNITEENLQDPAWVENFVRNNAMLAMAMSRDHESFSRSSLDWLTGSARDKRVPGREARARFKELLDESVGRLMPEYLRGWAERAQSRIPELRRKLEDNSRDNDEESVAKRHAALAELSHIRRVMNLMDKAWAEGRIPDESEFAEWTGLRSEVDGIDLAGDADAEQDSEATARREASIPDGDTPVDPETGEPDVPVGPRGPSQGLMNTMPSPRVLRRVARGGGRNAGAAAMRLSEMHRSGERGVEIHTGKSDYWFNVAMATAEDSEALEYLGRYHASIASRSRKPSSIKRNRDKARKYFERAVEAGSASANSMLGDMLLEDAAQESDPGRKGELRTQALEKFRLAGVWRRELEVPQAAPQATESPQTPSSAPDTPVAPEATQAPTRPSRTPVERRAIKTPPPAVENTDIIEEQRRYTERVQRDSEERARQQEREAVSAREAELTEQVRRRAQDDGLDVRLEEVGESKARRKVVAAMKKLGRRVEFVRILETRERPDGGRRVRRASGFRGFVMDDPDVVYIVVAPESMSSEASVTQYYLQAALHEVGHDLVQDPEVQREVSKLLTDRLRREFESQFDLGVNPQERREELLVYTLTQGVIRSSGVDTLLLGEGFADRVIKAIRKVFGSITGMNSRQARSDLLKKIVSEQIQKKKKAKEISKGNPASEVVGQFADTAPQPQRASRKKGDEQQGTLFMRERTPARVAARIRELANLSDMFDERGFGAMSHPSDGNDVDAEGVILDRVLPSMRVPGKYLKSTEEFDYLASAIHHVLIEKSTDSNDYERAAQSMAKALRTGVVDYDQIVLAARNLGWAGTSGTVDSDIVSEQDTDAIDVMELLDDLDGDGDIRFMRGKTTSQLAADHRAAFERGDEAAAARIVEVIARRRGYKTTAWHSGTLGTDGDFVPYTETRGMHFGTERAAADRAYQVAKESLYRSGSVQRNIDGSWSWSAGPFRSETQGDPDGFPFLGAAKVAMSNFIDDLGPEQLEAMTASQDGLGGTRLRTTKAYLRLGKTITMEDTGQSDWSSQVWLARNSGYDSIKYKNIEEDAGSTSYIILDSSQAKSADPFTYDSNGELIPLDKRFDDSTSDIRFMRERPKLSDLKRMVDSLKVGDGSLKTALFWEYSNLDEALDEYRRQHGEIADSLNAAELFQIAGGIRNLMMDRFKFDEVDPFEARIKSIAERNKLSEIQVEDMIKEYAYVVHVQDAIRRIQQLNIERGEARRAARKKIAEDASMDATTAAEEFDTLEAKMLEEIDALGMTMDQAVERQRALEQEFTRMDGDMMGAVTMLRQMNLKTLELRREKGLITEEAYQAVRDRYPNYVPIVRSIFNDEQAIEPGKTSSKTKTRDMRSMRGGQIAEEGDERSFWAASYQMTQYDRMITAHRVAHNDADMAMFELALQDALASRDGGRLLEPVFVEDMMAAAVRRSAVGDERVSRMRTRIAELRKLRDEKKADQDDLADLKTLERELQQILDQNVGSARSDARADLRRQIEGTDTEPATVRRFKINRDIEHLPMAIQEDITEILSSEDGLTQVERLRNLDAARAFRAAKTDAQRAAAKKRTVAPRSASKRQERAAELREKHTKTYPKGTLMHYRINDPVLSAAMLSRRPTFIEKSLEAGGFRGSLAAGWMTIMNYLRFGFVTFSPGFWIGELFRSPMQASIMSRVMMDKYNLSREQVGEFARNMETEDWRFMGIQVRGFYKAFPFLAKRWRSVRHMVNGGEPRNEYEARVRDAMEAGVLQGGVNQVRSFEEMSIRVRKDIEMLMNGKIESARKRGIKNVGANFVGGVEMITTAMDLVNRMHVFIAAQQSGISRQKAAVMAREATVDFGKKGAKNRGINQFYLFFNPRMQGVHQLLRAFTSGDAGLAGRAATRFLSKYFLYALALKMFSEFVVEDDETPETWQGKFASLQNILMPVWRGSSEDGSKGKWYWLEIRNPYGFGAVAKLANRFGEVVMGDAPVGELLMGGIGDFAAELSPVQFDGGALLNLKEGGLKSLTSAITPTPVQPVTELIFNRDWKGAPIAPLGFSFGPGESRDSLKYWPDTWDVSIAASQGIAALTGAVARLISGPSARGVEISPNQIGYIFERYTPGLARQVGDTLAMARGLSDGDLESVDQVPIANLLVGESGGPGVIGGRYRDLVRYYEAIRADRKADGDAVVRERYGDTVRILGFVRSTQSALKKLREQKNSATERDDLKRAKEISRRMTDLQKRALERAVKMGWR